MGALGAALPTRGGRESSEPGRKNPRNPISLHSFSASFAASFLLPQSLTFAVLQDSLAPLLFSVYTLALGELMQSRGAESVREGCRMPVFSADILTGTPNSTSNSATLPTSCSGPRPQIHP